MTLQIQACPRVRDWQSGADFVSWRSTLLSGRGIELSVWLILGRQGTVPYCLLGIEALHSSCHGKCGYKEFCKLCLHDRVVANTGRNLCLAFRSLVLVHDLLRIGALAV